MPKARVTKGNGPAPYALITPATLTLLVIIVLPILYTFWLSFHYSTFGGPPQYVGLSNYRELFQDRAFWRALLNNVIFVNVVVYGELLLGMSFAVFFARKVLFKKLMISIVMAPYAVSPVLGVLMWRFLWEPDIGAINNWLSSLELPQLLWTVKPVHAFILIVLIAIWLQVPFTFLILYNSILGIPSDLFDSARVDGASGWQVFRYITVPSIMPAIIVSLMFRYIFAFRTFDVVWILTEGGPYRTTELLSVYLYKRAFTYYEFGIGSAVAWIMVLVTVLIASYYLRVMYRRMFKNE